MRNWIEKITPKTPMGQRVLMVALVVAVGIGAFLWGRRQQVVAGDPNPDPLGLSKLKGSSASGGERHVAYLYNKSMPITREELGEYLINRFGAERLEFMINRKIVEIECAKHKIYATDAEVEDRFAQDLRSFGKIALTIKEFENNVLRRFNKTLYEWKEDVIRPKIMMEKLVKDLVKVTEEDVKDGFEARFGPKVQCRMIVLPTDSRVVDEVWKKARVSADAFTKEARQQFVPNLAQTAGEVPPIHKHFGDKLIEATAFRLRENEVSEPLRMKDGTWVILLCEKHLPANPSVRYDQVWLQIHKEVQEFKIAQKMPETFAKLRDSATPQLLLAGAVSHVTRLEQPSGTTLSTIENSLSTRPLPSLTDVPPPVPTKVVAPQGISPLAVPNAPPQPLNIVAPLPKIDLTPIEKK